MFSDFFKEFRSLFYKNEILFKKIITPISIIGVVFISIFPYICPIAWWSICIVLAISLFVIIARLLENCFEKNHEDLYKQNESYKKELEKNKQALRVFKSIVEGILIDTLKRIGEKLNFPHEIEAISRITLFAIGNNECYAICRYSKNARLAEINAYKNYELRNGAIAKAYEHGWFFLSGENIPDYAEYPDDYCAVMQKYGYKKEEIEGMAMKSRCYAAIRLPESDGKLVRGVLLAESIKPAKWEEDFIKKILQRPVKDLYNYLRRLDVSLKEHRFIKQEQSVKENGEQRTLYVVDDFC